MVSCKREESRGEKWGGTDNQRERRARERKRRSNGGSAICQAWSVRKSTLVWVKKGKFRHASKDEFNE